MSLLSDDQLGNRVTTLWTHWRTQRSNFSVPTTWWDAGKLRLRILIRDYCHEKSREKLKQRVILESALRNLESRKQCGDQVDHLINNVKITMDSFLTEHCRGAKVRARIQWAQEGETPYFLRQEKVRGQCNSIGAIRDSAGAIVYSQDEISLVWQEYYSSLFSADVLDGEEQDFFLSKLSSFLSPTDSGLCDGPISMEECAEALRDMNSGKAPGLDGFPVEFYRKFWDLIGPDLLEVFNFSFSNGRLPFSQRSGGITLLYKKGDVLDVRNWRPITLLCADYKILAKVLANRLLKVIATVVSPDQTCSVPGRFIGTNIRFLRDLVYYANVKGIGGAVISLAQEKAFDRVDWSFMLDVLNRMGFGESFCSWVALLYTGVFSGVIVNRRLGNLFPVARGV